MKRTSILIALICFLTFDANAFCGFYVAKAGSDLFNDKSQVILVRDGKRTTVTMSNDFKGNVKDFAMVVPVPTVLKQKDIKVVKRNLFDKIDAYSAPRMSEYYDRIPCMGDAIEMYSTTTSLEAVQISQVRGLRANKSARKYKVKIEAQYSVEEYDVIVLSAKESNGLKRWLIDNGYKIPEEAESVLEPYIKNQMKFFVVKVNLNKMPKSEQGYLRPLQISYESDRFMLPIRLGMANSSGEQDMIVYAFTKKGRIECTNYRTVKLPTDRNIPSFVKSKNEFGDFYVDLFEKAYDNESKKAVFLEYAWDVSPKSNRVKCDPCVSPPPVEQQFADAGIWWSANQNGSSNVFFTRLHVRYSRDNFPQDLFFQVTPNREQYQCRYYIYNAPGKGDYSCEEGQKYIKKLHNRRQKEVDELAALCGWQDPSYEKYIQEYDHHREQSKDENEERKIVFPVWPDFPGKLPLSLLIGTMICVAGIGWRLKPTVQY
ncbi:MAG: DUF2330 domain-containing protein [Bacteroidota bacterium]